VLVDGFSAGPTDTNCYIVAPGPGQECVVIDPGIGADDDVDARLREHRLKPVAVILTHGHFDHTFSVVPVCGARDIPAYIHPADRGQLTDPWSPVGLPKGIPLFGRLQWTEPDDVRELSDGQVLDLAGVRLRVDLAPGHTPGSVTFATTEPVELRRGEPTPVLFSGDLIFAGSVGRTDFPGGSYAALLESLARVVLPLPDDTIVLSGHGPATYVGHERAANPFLAEAVPHPSGPARYGPTSGPRTGL